MTGAPPLDRLGDRHPHARLLSNGRYRVLVSGAGSGWSACGDLALTAFDADPTADGIGLFVYLAEPDRGALRSAGHRPVDGAEEYSATASPGRVTIVRRGGGLETTLDVAVDPDADREVRRLLLVNASAERRTVAVTTYAEIVLAPLAAHRAHPAFSKLFVETEAVPERSALLASRRPRSATEARPWMGHALVGGDGLEWETDRVRFVGRGGTLGRPAALDGTGPLGGGVGSVLDPVFALRKHVTLEAGSRARLDLVLACGASREDVLGALALDPGGADEVLLRAAARERALRERLGLDDDAAEALQEAAAAALYGDPRLLGREAASGAGADYLEALGTGAAPASAPPDEPARAACEERYRPAPAGGPPADSGERLLLDGGFGGFSSDGREYVIRLDPRDGGPGRPPMPWANVVANERFGFLVTESGAASTWSGNSRENRLTPWANDPVVDPHDEALWVRDEDEGVFASPLPGPTPGGAYEARHGFGESRWRHRGLGLEQEVVTFVPRADPLKATVVRLRNLEPRPRRLSVFSYARLVLGGLSSETAPTVETEIAGGAVLARNPARPDFGACVAFAAAVGGGAVHATADRAAFLGRNRAAASPAALACDERLDGRAGRGLDPCAALQVEVRLEAGGAAEVVFLLGEGASEDETRALLARWREPGAAARALDEVRAFWSRTLSALEIRTPSLALDLLANGWLLYQAVSCRLWGRTALYQSGGAFGFRDQLQDSAALVYSRPDWMRAQIVLHAGHQFVEGDVLHWWHPPGDRGTRTRCSDDLLWLPYLTGFYVARTGDASVLDEPAPFQTARALEPGEDEDYLQPSLSGESAPVYEHCVRAIERSLGVGAHGLPRIGTCDWNDGMNRVGREGRGESVWLAFFLASTIDAFAPLAEARGDGERARRWREHREHLRRAVEEQAWDGDWYRRAYYDDGTPLGSSASLECRIDALAQSWAVISGLASRERAERAMAAAERELVDDEAGIVRLLTPPFDRAPEDPGYIKGYVPGIRENGGQYTHGALWVVRALAELGRRDRAAAVLEMLSPVRHAADEPAARRYAVEPYVVAADVYGAPPHVGRGGWTWYTGSAAWMYRVLVESVLGLELDRGERLRLRPRVPDEWPGFTLRYRLPDGRTSYEIAVDNPDGAAETVVGVEVDGAPGTVEGGAASVPLLADGRAHTVRVRLGAG